MSSWDLAAATQLPQLLLTCKDLKDLHNLSSAENLWAAMPSIWLFGPSSAMLTSGMERPRPQGVVTDVQCLWFLLCHSFEAEL